MAERPGRRIAGVVPAREGKAEPAAREREVRGAGRVAAGGEALAEERAAEGLRHRRPGVEVAAGAAEEPHGGTVAVGVRRLPQRRDAQGVLGAAPAGVPDVLAQRVARDSEADRRAGGVVRLRDREGVDVAVPGVSAVGGAPEVQLLSGAVGAQVVDGVAAPDERGRGRFAAAPIDAARAAVIDLRAPAAAERADLRAPAGLRVARVALGDVQPGARGGGLHERESMGDVALVARAAAAVGGGDAHRGVARRGRGAPARECGVGRRAVLRDRLVRGGGEEIEGLRVARGHEARSACPGVERLGAEWSCLVRPRDAAIVAGAQDEAADAAAARVDVSGHEPSFERRELRVRGTRGRELDRARDGVLAGVPGEADLGRGVHAVVAVGVQETDLAARHDRGAGELRLGERLGAGRLRQRRGKWCRRAWQRGQAGAKEGEDESEREDATPAPQPPGHADPSASRFPLKGFRDVVVNVHGQVLLSER